MFIYEGTSSTHRETSCKPTCTRLHTHTHTLPVAAPFTLVISSFVVIITHLCISINSLCHPGPKTCLFFAQLGSSLYVLNPLFESLWLHFLWSLSLSFLLLRYVLNIVFSFLATNFSKSYFYCIFNYLKFLNYRFININVICAHLLIQYIN